VFEREYLDDCLLQLRTLKAQGEKAIGQIDDTQFFALIDPDANSIALIVKHVAGNMRSRWTDFLTTDGEKPNRNRDGEFEQDTTDTRAALMARWEHGWSLVFGAIGSLQPSDLGQTVIIRGEPQTVIHAINRQVSHYSAHVGQIVLLAKHLAGSRWQTLSIPKAKRPS
jgi:hypothetical protein